MLPATIAICRKLCSLQAKQKRCFDLKHPQQVFSRKGIIPTPILRGGFPLSAILYHLIVKMSNTYIELPEMPLRYFLAKSRNVSAAAE